MLSTATQHKLEDILSRLADGQEVGIEERIYLNKFADQDPKVASWLTRAKRKQQQEKPIDEIDQLLTDLDICSTDPDENFHPEHDDLGNWFSGAPSWLGRS